MTSADSEKRLKDMSSGRQFRLAVLLQPETLFGNDYRGLACKMGYSNEYIRYLGSQNDLAQILIKEKGDTKVVELISMLEDMERHDVVQELQEILSKVCPHFIFGV